ncbi:hypothetical protein ACIBTZ_31920 [Micromonospora sp. NPDC049460]|uniref:hypothetical protein n=1 Tax=Micromonospora sp. NPDC049460 TaxID=3364272 RepID=UPI003787B744
MALAVLTDLPGLLDYPRTADRAGRSGFGLAAASRDGRARWLLILHPDTGEVPAHEAARRTGVGWLVVNYVLYLIHSHAPRRCWEPSYLPERAQPPPRLYPHLKRRWIVHADHPCTTTTAPA